ncbi:MAG: histidine--tRNA ligase [Candidatus Anstonellaceae archaeon]
MAFQLPKGTKDYAFEEARAITEIKKIIEQIYSEWGYEPLYTPAMEMLTVLNAKSGEEITGQIFRIEDSDYGLRFDLTVGSARFIASSSIPKPYKRYSLGLVWRREEPQKGRLREFYQLDADIFGTSSPKADAEIIAMGCEILEKLGFKEYQVIINNREILSALIKKYKQGQNENKILRLLDKTDKVGEDEIKKELEKIQLQKELIEKLFSLDMKTASEICPDGYKRIKEIVEILLNDYNINQEKIKVDFSLARGLAYYTSTVFEIKLTKEFGSVAGGGRYDELLSLYGKGEPAVGISFGLERLLLLMQKQNKENKIKQKKPIYIVSTQDEYYKYAIELARKLRSNGIEAICDITERKLSGKLEYASINFYYVVIIGKEEVEKKEYTLKNLLNGEQKKLGFEELVGELEKKVR